MNSYPGSKAADEEARKKEYEEGSRFLCSFLISAELATHKKFHAEKKHVFILSNAGKPIYSRLILISFLNPEFIVLVLYLIENDKLHNNMFVEVLTADTDPRSAWLPSWASCKPSLL